MTTLYRSLSAAAVAAVLGLAACTASGPEPGAGAAEPAAGDTGDAGDGAARSPVPVLGFEAPTLDGPEFAGASLEGEAAVLWFWAPWCTVCRGEAPGVAAAAERHAGRVDFLGVAGRGEVEDMRAFTADTGTGQMRHLVDEDGAIWSGFGVVGQPSFAFLRPDGTFETVAGVLSEDELDDYVEDVLPSADEGDS